jgi:hypothetical protein
VRNEADADSNEYDSGPALERDGFMQPEAGKEGDNHVAECGCGKNESEIGPGQRGQILGKEPDQQSNAKRDPWGEYGGDERSWMRKRDGWKRGHAAREASIPEWRAESDHAQDHVLARR